MVRRVLEETRKACDKLEFHPLNADEAANLAQAIVISPLDGRWRWFRGQCKSLTDWNSCGRQFTKKCGTL
jgi:hypothetical protein